MKKIEKVTKKIKDSLEKTQTIQMVKRITKSRVDQNSHLYTEENNPDVKPLNENLSLTKQQKFNFDSNKFEYETKNNKKKKNKELKYEIKKELLEAEKEKNKYKKKFHIFLTLFLIIIIILSVSIYYHITYEPKTIIKEKEVKIVDENIVFLGDSITHRYDLDKYYEGYNTVNSGVDGNTTDDILSDMKNRVYNYNPSRVYILIGTNDLQQGRTNDEIVENIKKIVNSIKEKRTLTKLYIESVYPVIEGKDSAGNRKNEDIKMINESIKEFCMKNKIEYINLYDELKNENEFLKDEYTKDGLHISDKGYEVITKKIKETIKK